jgi:hypothetical protein
VPLILPESAEVAAWKAEQAQQVESKVRQVERLEGELKSIDPSLSLVVAKPGSQDVGLIPGRWHVKKEIPNKPDEYWPLVGENDSYREPGAWVLDAFNAGDLWDPRVHRDKREAKRKLREARVRAKRLEAEQRADEIAYNAAVARRVRDERGLKTTSQPKREAKGLKTPRKASQEP